MRFCFSSILVREFAFTDALSVGVCTGRAQLPAGGKNAFASRCWTCGNPSRKISYYCLNQSTLVIKQ
jgi:hypothetical protein